jgi:hypothetical protein
MASETAMSSYLVVKIRTAPDGRVTEAVMRQMELSPHGDQMLGLMDEQHWGSAGIANLIACGHSVYVGVHGLKGEWVYGDEVKVVGPQHDLQSVDDEGLRTYSLGHLPQMD